MHGAPMLLAAGYEGSPAACGHPPIVGQRQRWVCPAARQGQGRLKRPEWSRDMGFGAQSSAIGSKATNRQIEICARGMC